MASVETMPIRETTSAETAPSLRFLGARVVALVVLLVVFGSWSQRHLGTAIPGLVLAGVGLLGRVYDFLGGAERATHQRRLRGITVFLLGDRFLGYGFLIMLLCCAFVASVTVMAAGVAADGAVRLAPEGKALPTGAGKQLAGRDAVVRFLRLTTPMGRPFYLAVDGFQRHSFDLLPWTGRTVRLDRDLRRSPAVVVRVPKNFVGLLGSCTIELQRDDAPPIVIPTEAGHGSLALGRPLYAPAALLDEWRSELKAEQLPDAASEFLLRLWREPQPVSGLTGLAPGDRIHARLLNPDGQAIAQARFLVSEAEVQDVLLAVGGE